MSGGRRRFLALGAARGLALGAAGGLAGCGFRPLYLPASRGGFAGGEELAAIYVPVIAERSGQLLRQALQRRFEGAGTGIAKKYDVVANLALSQEGIAVQRDSSTTRIRLVGTATYTLRELNLAHTVLTSGSARVLDGYNILNQQYFAADLENEAAVRRVAETTADQVAQQLAVWFKNRAAGADRPAGPPPAPTPPSSIPPDAASPILIPGPTNEPGPGPF